ncbi:lytic transglycosylase domain-containing protein [uncultured Algimonas sp.]|uniref:lytic transglycosylase domain-containing protein n=1 Tax=uncultured Algimonas sp. TaxID=1547920 RepID=UPI0026192949|nr:lytic transglycosylase domain-containing protein [uncultured Algimonas sp.]
MKTVFTALLAGAALLSPVPAVMAQAQTGVAPLPRLKPPPAVLSEYIGTQDSLQLRKGFSAAERGDWQAMTQAMSAIQDPTARDLLRWLRAARDPNVPTAWLTNVVHDLPDWPRMVSIRAKAEGRLFDEPVNPREAVAWFRGEEPVSGEGRAVLANAFYALGDPTQGDRWLKSAWREARLTRDRQQTLFAQHRSRLNAQDHSVRADHLIWLGRSHFGKARALLPHMSAADRAVMDARMKLASNGSGITAAINAIPASRAKDPGFLYERARWRRQNRTREEALPVYLQIGAPAATERGRERMWTEKRLMAYWLFAEKQWGDAYRMVQNIGADEGAPFYESEFLGGWIALTKLGQPARALEHFRRLEAGVNSPISLARALYWQGRAHEAMNNAPARAEAYQAASRYPNTYYGQLATKRLNGTDARLSLPAQTISAQAKQRFDADRRVRALRLLGEAGEERLFSTFSYALDDQLESLDELALLSQLAADYGQMRASIRAAKQSGRFRSMLTDAGYPIVGPIERLDPALFDIPFVYAIARQESEFSANAVSTASAMGMMQMINATASATARRHGIPYDRDRLITDRDYGAMMGALHLNDLLEDFDGNYIMAAVAYNAGPRRVGQWIERNGDPRTGEIDPIDWVEKIPFSETRNYVMRVMENMQVYEARRNGNVAPVTIDQKLRFGQRATR